MLYLACLSSTLSHLRYRPLYGKISTCHASEKELNVTRDSRCAVVLLCELLSQVELEVLEASG